MPQHCHYRPNRTEPRRFSERDAARIICRVMADGGTIAGITARWQEMCGDRRPRPKSAAEAALELAMANIDQNNATLTGAYDTFNIINAIINALFAVLPLFRLIRGVAALARLTRTAERIAGPGIVQANLTNITTQQASNAAAYRIIQQAAANEARFRLTGTR
jgi:hypothetical protein